MDGSDLVVGTLAGIVLFGAGLGGGLLVWPLLEPGSPGRWRRVWLEPVPGVGLRAATRKARWGWWLLYRDPDGRCWRRWEPRRPAVVPRRVTRADVGATHL